MGSRRYESLPTLDRYFFGDQIIRDTFHIHTDLYWGVPAILRTSGVDCLRGDMQRLSYGSCAGRTLWHDGHHVLHGQLSNRDGLGLRGHFLALLQFQLPLHLVLHLHIERNERIIAIPA